MNQSATRSAKRGSKAYRAAAAKIDFENHYAPLEAIALAQESNTGTFDASIDVSMRLGVDPRKADQMVRGTINLPHGTGKTSRVLVFASGANAEAAREAGADFVGDDDMVEKVNGGWLDFEAVVATPEMLGKAGRLGRGRCPRGLLPQPRPGPAARDAAKAVGDTKGGQLVFRVARHATLHFLIGRASFSAEQLTENYAAAVDEIMRLKPASAKGRYIKKVTISSTMGQGVPVDPNSAPVTAPAERA